MDIVIKSFRRPFYLDRLLHSITKYCSGYGNILISDGGTDRIFIDKLNSLYKNIKWDISKSINKRTQIKKYLNPLESTIQTDDNKLSLWRGTVEKVTTDYFLLMEDDCWITEYIDLSKYSELLASINAQFSKLWFASPLDQRFSSSSLIVNLHSSIHYPDTIEYIPRLSSINSLYNYFIMGQSVFRKEYYLAATNGAYVEDETSQIMKAFDFLKKLETPIPRCFQTLNRVAYQGWGVSIRSDDAFLIESGFSGFNLADALSKAWLNDDLNSNENFPFDFSASFIINKLESIGYNKNSIMLYKKWREGCSINSNNILL